MKSIIDILTAKNFNISVEDKKNYQGYLNNYNNPLEFPKYAVLLAKLQPTFQAFRRTGCTWGALKLCDSS